jgi:hypothetical protein
MSSLFILAGLGLFLAAIAILMGTALSTLDATPAPVTAQPLQQPQPLPADTLIEVYDVAFTPLEVARLHDVRRYYLGELARAPWLPQSAGGTEGAA